MEVSINLLPSMPAHCFSYGLVNWAILSGIPVIIDMWLNVDSHIYQDPKVCKDFRRSNGFPSLLIERIMKSDILCSCSNWIYPDSLRIEVRTLYNMIND